MLSNIPESTAINTTREKAEKILLEDQWGNYVILGILVYNHMSYDKNYLGISFSIDEI